MRVSFLVRMMQTEDMMFSRGHERSGGRWSNVIGIDRDAAGVTESCWELHLGIPQNAGRSVLSN